MLQCNGDNCSSKDICQRYVDYKNTQECDKYKNWHIRGHNDNWIDCVYFENLNKLVDINPIQNESEEDAITRSNINAMEKPRQLSEAEKLIYVKQYREELVNKRKNNSH